MIGIPFVDIHINMLENWFFLFRNKKCSINQKEKDLEHTYFNVSQALPEDDYTVLGVKWMKSTTVSTWWSTLNPNSSVNHEHMWTVGISK